MVNIFPSKFMKTTLLNLRNLLPHTKTIKWKGTYWGEKWIQWVLKIDKRVLREQYDKHTSICMNETWKDFEDLVDSEDIDK